MSAVALLPHATQFDALSGSYWCGPDNVFTAERSIMTICTLSGKPITGIDIDEPLIELYASGMSLNSGSHPVAYFSVKFIH